MDKKKEQNHETASEKKQQQKSDNSRQWLKLLPAAAVFAAVCVTCYQAEKTPVQTVEVSDADIMSTADIKSMLTLEDSTEDSGNSKSTSDKNTKTSGKKHLQQKRKQVRSQPEQRKILPQELRQVAAQEQQAAEAVPERPTHLPQKFHRTDM